MAALAAGPFEGAPRRAAPSGRAVPLGGWRPARADSGGDYIFVLPSGSSFLPLFSGM